MAKDNKAPALVVPEPLAPLLPSEIDDIDELLSIFPPEHQKAIDDLGPNLVDQLFERVERELADEMPAGPRPTPITD